MIRIWFLFLMLTSSLAMAHVKDDKAKRLIEKFADQEAYAVALVNKFEPIPSTTNIVTEIFWVKFKNSRCSYVRIISPWVRGVETHPILPFDEPQVIGMTEPDFCR